MANGLLLDTCALIWMSEDAPVAAQATAAMNAAFAAGQPIYVSPISAWEHALLIAKGRLSSPLPPKVWFARAMALGALRLAPLSPDILADSSFLPGPVHADPADRIIIATARHLDVPIVTRDQLILDYAALGHVRALAC